MLEGLLASLLFLGMETTKGLGAGGNPEYGRKAAEESEAEIRESVKGSDMVFITAGMGGESLMGVLLAGVIVVSVTSGGSEAPLRMVSDSFGDTAQWLGLLVNILLIIEFARRVITAKLNK